MNDLCTEIGYKSINHDGEQLCGDHIDIVEQGDDSMVIVLADGLGSGVKASILSTLTSRIISTMMAAGISIEECVSTIAATLPVCSVRGVAYSTFTIIHLIHNQTAELIQYDNPMVIMIRNGIDPEDAAAISRQCQSADITIEYINGEQAVILNGENVNAFLRKEEVGAMASRSSVNPDVRTKLMELQRQLAARTDVVMDGRDIGTVVLPDARVKIYLTASVDVRAKRRYDELAAKGQPADYDTIFRELQDRDYRDMHRDIAPLKQAEDAVLVDTSDMTIEEVADRILEIYREKAVKE